MLSDMIFLPKTGYKVKKDTFSEQQLYRNKKAVKKDNYKKSGQE